MATFTERDAALDDIAASIRQAVADLDAAKARIKQVKDRLAVLQSQYAGLSAEIDSAATNAPSDSAIQDQKARKDKYLADFVTVRNRAGALDTAVQE